MKSPQVIGAAYRKLKSLYALDIRALSLMRILSAAVLLIDLVIRATSFTAHYTEHGAVPLNEVARVFWADGFFSLYGYSDDSGYVAFLFALSGLVYACLLIGYRTRIMSVLAWLLLLSLHNRNPVVLQCGDDQLRLLLFWGMFLPWGNFYSVDAHRYPRLKTETRYFDVPGLAYLLLIFSVYFFTGILKNSAEWDSREGSAFYYALSLDQLALPLGKKLLAYPALLKALTLTARWVELLAPFLLLIPYRNAFFRMAAFFILCGFHVAIGLTLFVGLFYLISIVALTGLLSARAMDKMEKMLRIKREGPAADAPAHPAAAIEGNYYFRVIRNCFVFFCMGYCFIWNVGSVPASGLRISASTFRFGYALRLDQRWNMFAPTVAKGDGWFVMDALTRDKEHIDINREGQPVDFSKPEQVLKYIKDDRWRKFHENYTHPDNAFMRPYYCRYLLRTWNENNPGREVDSLRIVFMSEFTPPPGRAATVVQKEICKCAK